MKQLIPLVLACAAVAAHAHVTLEYPVAPAGSQYKAAFKVGHGCGASATRQLVVEIPAGVKSVHPVPRPGWSLAIDRDAAGEPARITWTAKSRDDMLASAHYDEFVLVGQLPAQAAMLYWPVRQLCEEGRADWVEVPAAGQKLHDLKAPAAPLELLPAGGSGEHQH